MQGLNNLSQYYHFHLCIQASQFKKMLFSHRLRIFCPGNLASRFCKFCYYPLHCCSALSYYTRLVSSWEEDAQVSLVGIFLPFTGTLCQIHAKRHAVSTHHLEASGSSQQYIKYMNQPKLIHPANIKTNSIKFCSEGMYQ